MSCAVTRTRPACRLDAALEHVADAQLLADLAHVDRLALVGRGGVAGDHAQVGVAGEVGDEVLGDPVGEPLPAWGRRERLSNGSTATEGLPAAAVPPATATTPRPRPGPASSSSGGRRGRQAPARRTRRARAGAPVAVEPHPVGPHRPLDVLDPLLARELERQVELALEVVVGGAGDHHPAGLGQLLQAGGDVHPVAVEVAVGLEDHVAEVDADPEADALGLGHRPPRARPCPAGSAPRSAPRRPRSRTRRARRRPSA